MMKVNYLILTGLVMLTLSLSSCGNKDVRQMNKEIKQIEHKMSEMAESIGNLESKLKEAQGEAKLQIENQINSIKQTIDHNRKIKEQLDKEALNDK